MYIEENKSINKNYNKFVQPKSKTRFKLELDLYMFHISIFKSNFGNCDGYKVLVANLY